MKITARFSDEKHGKIESRDCSLVTMWNILSAPLKQVPLRMEHGPINWEFFMLNNRDYFFATFVFGSC